MPLLNIAVIVAAFALHVSQASAGRACPAPCIERLELVTGDAGIATDSNAGAGNPWGGHQSRIVRTIGGDVFVVYLVAGSAVNHGDWRVAKRTLTGWQVVGAGPSGREPAHLLLAPTGDLVVIAWPDGVPIMWTGVSSGDTLRWRSEAVPGAWLPTQWPYGAAGIGPDGNVCVVQSTDVSDRVGASILAACRAPQKPWRFARYPLPHRFAYAFPFPVGNGLEWVAMRDVRWTELGYKQPEGAFAWVYNAIGAWRVDSLGAPPAWSVLIRDEPPINNRDEVRVSLKDAILDGQGRLQVAYEANHLMGAASRYAMRRAMIVNGVVTLDRPLPALPSGRTSGFHRIILAPNDELFWIFGSGKEAYIARLGIRDSSNAPVSALDRGAYPIDYSGISIANARGGTPPDSIVDMVFPSGRSVVYARLRLPTR